MYTQKQKKVLLTPPLNWNLNWNLIGVILIGVIDAI